MGLTDQVCRIQFIPKNQDTFRAKSAKNTIAQYLNMNEFTIGSSKEANIIYKMKGIHPIHLRIIVRGRDLYVEDVFSSTGVTINGKIIKPGDQVPYKSGEFIQLGSSPDIITVEMFRKPIDPRLESQQIVLDAEKKANEILRDANSKTEEASLADEKSQALIDAAKDKADEVLTKRKKELELLYEEKVRAAIREGEDRAGETSKSIMESAQKEVHMMLMNARNEAEDIRKEGESKKTEALQKKEGIEKENEQLLIRKKDLEKHIENVLSENEDILSKNAELIDKAQQIESQYATVESEFKTFKAELEEKKSEAIKEISDIEDEYNKVKEDLQLAQQNCSEAIKETDFQNEKRDELQEDIFQKKKEIQAVKREIDDINDSKKTAISEADRVKEEAKAQMDDVKKTLEDEYEKRKEREVERLQVLREREQVRLYQTIDDLTAAITEELEFELTGLNAETHKLFIGKAVKRVVVEEFELREKVLVESVEPLKEEKKPSVKIPPFKFKRSMAMPFVAMAAVVGFFAIKGPLSAESDGLGSSRNIQSVSKDGAKEGSAKKIIKTPQWKSSYTDNILLTEKYLLFTKNQKINKKLKSNLEEFLSVELEMDKDAIVKFTVQEGMLIWELKKMRNQIKTKNSERKIKAMKSKEKDLVLPLVEILGGKKQFERYFDFQATQFKKAYK